MNLRSASEQNLYWTSSAFSETVVWIRNLSPAELSKQKRVAGQHVLHRSMAPGSAPPNLDLLDCALVNIPVAPRGAA